MKNQEKLEAKSTTFTLANSLQSETKKFHVFAFGGSKSIHFSVE